MRKISLSLSKYLNGYLEALLDISDSDYSSVNIQSYKTNFLNLQLYARKNRDVSIVWKNIKKERIDIKKLEENVSKNIGNINNKEYVIFKIIDYICLIFDFNQLIIDKYKYNITWNPSKKIRKNYFCESYFITSEKKEKYIVITFNKQLK